MLQNSFRFLAILLITLIIGYGIQTWLVGFFSFSDNFSLRNLSYLFNGGYAILLVFAINMLRKNFEDQIGFVFLGSSFVKIGIFFIVAKLNSLEIDKSVFLDFFIPYVISLILEVYYISKILNSYK